MNFLVKKFYEEIKTNISFKQRILDAKKKYHYLTEPKEKVCTIIEKVVLPFAEQRGYNFDIYDLLIFEEEASTQGARLLEREDLSKVSGGNNGSSVSPILSTLSVNEDSISGITNWYKQHQSSKNNFLNGANLLDSTKFS